MRKYQIKEKIFKWQGKGAWFFIRINEKTSEDIRDKFGEFVKGWGSIPVNVTIGKSQWKTSIFPEQNKSYLLPIKSQIRKAEKIDEGDVVSLTIEIIEEKIEIKPPPITGY